jgi:hypothetical protein
MKHAKCSLKVVSSRTGKVLTGTAAILHLTSREGGFDCFMEEYGRKILKQTYDEVLAQSRRPKLRLVG